MRSDMSEVVIERPRSGHGDCHHPYRTRFDKRNLEALDDLPKHEGYRRPYSIAGAGKSFTDLLGPLERFLISCVGRPWNDVYSEICAQISPDSTVQIHILGHVKDMVTENVFFDPKGEVTCMCMGRWGPRRISYGEMYVDPNGILCRMPERGDHYYRTEKWREAVASLRKIYPRRWWGDIDAQKEAAKHHFIGPELELHKIDGIWYWAVFADVPPPFTSKWIDNTGEAHEKIVRRSGFDFITQSDVYEGRYRSHKVQANRRDLRRHGLENNRI